MLFSVRCLYRRLYIIFSRIFKKQGKTDKVLEFPISLLPPHSKNGIVLAISLSGKVPVHKETLN